MSSYWPRGVFKQGYWRRGYFVGLTTILAAFVLARDAVRRIAQPGAGRPAGEEAVLSAAKGSIIAPGEEDIARPKT